VWESAENTVEHVYKTESDKNTVWIMGLTNENASYPDSISFTTLKKIISSFKVD
jgi:hypothetical protein